MGKLRTLYLAILNRCEKISHKRDLLKVINEYKESINRISIKDALKYLSRHGYIKRIFLDYYYINSIEERELGYQKEYSDKELLFFVLNKVHWKWYLGLTSALYERGEIWQAPNSIIIINNRLSKEITIADMKVKFYKMKDALFFGILSKKTKHKIHYFYSDKEKTDLDFVYLRKYDQIDDPTKKTKEYTKRYPKWLQKLI